MTPQPNTDLCRRHQISTNIGAILSTEIKDNSNWLSVQQIRANMSVLLRESNVMPFRWAGNSYKCFFCTNKLFTDIEELRAHSNTTHQGYPLDIIRQAISCLKQIRIDITGLACKSCRESFENLHQLTEHLSEVHKIKYYKGVERCFFQVNLSEDKVKCFICGATFDYFQHLVQHSSQEHEEGTFLCAACGQGFEFQDKFVKHMSLKHSHVPIKCKYCEKIFTHPTNRKAHEAKYHNDAGYNCKECNYSFDTYQKMRKHLLSAHNQGTKHTCKQCSVTFIYKKMLQAHLQSAHLKERKKCPICNGMFMHLKDHMVCHDEVKPFTCEWCNKDFARRKNLIAHLKTHKKT